MSIIDEINELSEECMHEATEQDVIKKFDKCKKMIIDVLKQVKIDASKENLQICSSACGHLAAAMANYKYGKQHDDFRAVDSNLKDAEHAFN